jgi:hypothetical protein
MMVCLLL